MGENDTQIRINNDILSGPDIPVPIINENCVEVFRKLALDKLKLVIPTADISSAVRVGKSKTENNSPQTRAILVKLKILEVKKTLMITCRNVKPNFYVNDDLCQEKQTMLFVLRQAKKRKPNIVDGCRSMDGRIYVWIKPNGASADLPNTNRRIHINSVQKLKMFCTDIVDLGLETFISDWPY